MSRSGDYISREAVLEAAKKSHLYFDIKPIINSIPVADVVPGSDFRDCRNELCLYCGKYKERHNGACDGCRWRICE